MADTDPFRILLVSLDNLGDLVFASALTPLLRERYPQAKITLWCKEYTAPIARLVPAVHQIESADPFWDRSPGHASGSFVRFVRSVRRLRREQFELAILAAAPWRTAAAVAATGATRRIGLSRRKNARWLTDALAPEDVTQPVLSEMARLLVPLGITVPAKLRYRLDVSPLEARRERFRAALGPRAVALHPFASKRNRCVAMLQWIRLGIELGNRGYDPLWIGSARELQEVRREGGSVDWNYVDELGDGSLADTAAALSLSQLFVGHDSGPLHIAGAFGVPVVGVFTPGEPARTFPQGVGPSRMLVRASPEGVMAEDMLAVVDSLPGDRSLKLVR